MYDQTLTEIEEEIADMEKAEKHLSTVFYVEKIIHDFKSLLQALSKIPSSFLAKNKSIVEGFALAKEGFNLAGYDLSIKSPLSLVIKNDGNIVFETDGKKTSGQNDLLAPLADEIHHKINEFLKIILVLLKEHKAELIKKVEEF